MQVVIERLVDARLVVKGEDYVEPAHDALVRAWKTLHEWIHAVGRDTLIVGQRLEPDAEQFAQTRDAELLWNNNPNLAVAARALKDPQHAFNASELVFVRRSIARNRRANRSRGRSPCADAGVADGAVDLGAARAGDRRRAEGPRAAQPVRGSEPQHEPGAAGQRVRLRPVWGGAAR